MMIRRNLVLIFVFLLISSFTYSQKENKKLIKANVKYEEFAFPKANKLYIELIKKGHISAEIYAKLGDTYYFNANYPEALKTYSDLINLKEPFAPEYYYRYAQCLKIAENYIEASKMMQLYYNAIGQIGKSDEIKRIASPKAVINKQSGRYKITKEAINTPYSDFGVVFNGDKGVLYTTSGHPNLFIKRNHNWNGEPFLKLFSATVDANGNLNEPIELKGDINSKFHQTTPAITKDGETIYFTRNNYFNKNLKRDKVSGINKLKIYRAHKIGDKWGNIEELPYPINSDIFSSAHPALSPDGKKLYFVSDRDNELGNTDIYVVGITKDGTFENNLHALSSKINTEGRESFPYIDDYGILYFASDGQVGLGGLDIFAAIEDREGEYHVFNIGEPINSIGDDFGYIFNHDTKKGFFSSNREGGTGGDDIYSFIETKSPEYPFDLRPVVKGVIRDSISGALIGGVQITIFNDKKEKIKTIIADEEGKYSVALTPLRDHTFVFEKHGYTNDKVEVKGLKIQAEKELPVALFNELVVIVDDSVIVLQDGDDLTKKLKLKPIYFDYGLANIRKSSKLELDKVIDILRHHPNISIDVRSHTDSRGRPEFNLKLSEKRAKVTVDYIIKEGEFSPSRVTGRGYGQSQLLNGCQKGVRCTEEEHQLNRRSEFIVTINKN